MNQEHESKFNLNNSKLNSFHFNQKTKCLNNKKNSSSSKIVFSFDGKVNTNKTIYVGYLNMSLLEEIDYEVESSFKKTNILDLYIKVDDESCFLYFENKTEFYKHHIKEISQVYRSLYIFKLSHELKNPICNIIRKPMK